MQVKTILGVMASATLCAGTLAIAQQAADGSYSGVSRPPQDVIQTSPDQPAPVIAKPSAAVVASAPSATQYQAAPQASPQYGPQPSYQPSSAGPDSSYVGADGTQPAQPALSSRAAFVDPDAGIVHVRAAGPGELLEGSTIRVRLMERLSSSQSEKGEVFRGQVASDVLQDGKVLIPAGSGIEGRVTAASAGHFGGHGSLHLKPEAVILPDGSRFLLHAETTGTPGSKTRMGSEGSINPGSRAKKDGVEYGAVVGTGAIAGAVLGGPVGALTGSLVGAGIVTTHLMVDHPQATLEPGAVILFTTTEPMNLMPASN